MYDSGDTAVRAVGSVSPKVYLTLTDESVKMTLLNKSTYSQTFDVKVWSRNSMGNKTSLMSEQLNINANSQIDKSIPFAITNAVLIGTRLIDPIDGELLSENFLFLNQN